MSFKDQWQQSFECRQTPFIDAIRTYHRLTEEYDRTICSGQSYGEAIPVGNHELMLSNQFASKTKIRIQKELSITDTDWRTANKEYIRTQLARDLATDWDRKS